MIPNKIILWYANAGEMPMLLTPARLSNPCLKFSFRRDLIEEK